jgi:hypothetical protein
MTVYDIASATSQRAANAGVVFGYNRSTFAEVKETAFSGPTLCCQTTRTVGLKDFLQFLSSWAGNLLDKRDIRSWYRKLIHPNGISCAGVWRIDQDSPYIGHCARGSQDLCTAKGIRSRRQTAGGRLARIRHRRKEFSRRSIQTNGRAGNFVLMGEQFPCHRSRQRPWRSSTGAGQPAPGTTITRNRTSPIDGSTCASTAAWQFDLHRRFSRAKGCRLQCGCTGGC